MVIKMSIAKIQYSIPSLYNTMTITSLAIINFTQNTMLSLSLTLQAQWGGVFPK